MDSTPQLPHEKKGFVLIAFELLGFICVLALKE